MMGTGGTQNPPFEKRGIGMKTKFVRAAFVAALMSTAATFAMTTGATAQAYGSPPPAAGAMVPAGSGTHEPVTAGKVGTAVGKPLTVASKAFQDKDYKGALAALQEAQAVPNQTPYETYMINKFLAFAEINLGDTKAATKPAEDAADSPAMPDAERKEVLHNALILASNAGEYAKAVGYGQQLDQLGALDDGTAGSLAIAYYNQKDLPDAQKYAQKSIDLAKAAGKQPNEGVMQIVMSAQASTDQGAAERTLEQMVVTYDRQDDWDELVGVSLGVKGLTNADALNMYRVLYIQGAMKTGDDYTYMGNLAEAQRNFVEARNVLQAGVTAGKISAGAALSKARGEAAADEKIISQATSAAEKSKRGEDGMQIAQDLWGYGRYAEVESIATAAKAKGGLKDPGEANVLIGMAQIAQGKFDAGIATLGQVSGNAARMRTAHLWLLYAQSKQKAASTTAAPAPAPAPAK
jgi:tetratricopeptide (TPR) repeat protein